jgi:hypothetical protein
MAGLDTLVCYAIYSQEGYFGLHKILLHYIYMHGQEDKNVFSCIPGFYFRISANLRGIFLSHENESLNKYFYSSGILGLKSEGMVMAESCHRLPVVLLLDGIKVECGSESVLFSVALES